MSSMWKDFCYLLFHCQKMIENAIFFYTPRNEVRGGILDSPCLSVCLSVRLSVC